MDAVTKDGWVLEFVPQAMKTPQMCRLALNAPLAKLRENRSVLQFIPYADVCLEGIKKYRQEGADMVGLLADIEPEVMDEHIALYGVRTDPSCLTALPERWRYRATGLCCTTYRNIYARTVCARQPFGPASMHFLMCRRHCIPPTCTGKRW